MGTTPKPCNPGCWRSPVSCRNRQSWTGRDSPCDGRNRRSAPTGGCPSPDSSGVLPMIKRSSPAGSSCALPPLHRDMTTVVSFQQDWAPRARSAPMDLTPGRVLGAATANPARMAKLVDAPDLGSGSERSGGSSPLPRTDMKSLPNSVHVSLHWLAAWSGPGAIWALGGSML
jgi:hypothetical protein